LLAKFGSELLTNGMHSRELSEGYVNMVPRAGLERLVI